MKNLFTAVSADHHVDVLTNSEAAPSEGYYWARQTYSVKASAHYGMIGQARWATKSLYWIVLKASHYDIVHFHGNYLFNLVPALPLALRKSPYVLFALNGKGDLSRSGKLSKNPPLRAIRKLVLLRARKAFALSGEIAKEYRYLGIRADRIASLNNPVDISIYRPPSRAHTHRQEHQRIVFIGKLERRKRPDLILEALALLQNRPNSAGVTVVFAGPPDASRYLKNLKDLARDFNVAEKVEFLGHTEKVPDLLRNEASLFILCSSQEGLPGALVEAMACGVPPITTDVGAMGDILRASGAGRIIRPNADDLADAILYFLENRQAWDRSSKAAIHYARRHFSSVAIASRYISHISGGSAEGGKSHAVNR